MVNSNNRGGGGCPDFAPDAGNKKAIGKGRLWWPGGRERFNPFTLALWSTRGAIISWLWLCEGGGGRKPKLNHGPLTLIQFIV